MRCEFLGVGNSAKGRAGAVLGFAVGHLTLAGGIQTGERFGFGVFPRPVPRLW